MKLRLFHKFFLAFLAIGIAAVAIAGELIERELKADLTHQIEEELASGARIIALMPAGGIAARVEALAEHARARLTLIDASGKVVADSAPGNGEPDNHLNRSELQEARLRGKGSAIRYSRTLKKEMLYVAIPLRDGAGITGYVRLSRPVADITLAAGRMGQPLFDILLAVVVCLLLSALLFTFRILSPIGRLAAFTGKIRAGSAAGALRIESRDEIGDLAENINGMVAVLREEFRKSDEEKRKLEAVFAGMSEGVMVLDAENRIESVNREMEGMSGRLPGEMAGRTILEAFRKVELHDALERFRKKGESLREEIDLGNGRPMMMDVTISAVPDGTGGQRKTMLVFHDVTRLKRLEQIRTDFVANVTHEIRTPLTAIIGFAETLQQDACRNPEIARKFLQTIRENAERLNRLVDDLLTLSGLELGEAKLQPEALRIEEAMDRTLAIVEARVAERGLAIRREIPAGLPRIRADKDRLTQVLLNILDNAVKFTPPGGSIALTASPGEEGFLTVRIADTGVGIPKGEIPRLGERFYRADKTRSREMGGTGLGLSIVKHLMMAMQGRIAIDSTLGHGTTVSLFFPLYREDQDEMA